VTAVALRLLDAYAPARPVRLLGVRVAGLIAADASDRDASLAPGAGSDRRVSSQLALPVMESASESG
jgi:hypothetical protein